MGVELGPYAVLSRLGLRDETSTGTGRPPGFRRTLFSAVDTRSGVPVIVKLVPDPPPAALALARQRIDQLRTVRSSHVGAVNEALEIPEGLLIVSSPLPGSDLHSMLFRGHRFSPRTAFLIGAQLASGLGALHDRGVLHLDVKPSNIMAALLTDGVPHTWLIDLVPLHSQPEYTVDYASPTLLRGEPPDEGCDVYALGATMFVLLSGHLPFAPSTPEETIAAHLAGPPDIAPLCEVSLPQDAAELVISLMKAPVHTAWHWAGRLDAAAGALPESESPPRPSSVPSNAPLIAPGATPRRSRQTDTITAPEVVTPGSPGFAPASRCCLRKARRKSHR